MKRLLNTLYVTTKGAYLAREGETVQVRLDSTVKLSVPIHLLGGIVCFGAVTCSPYLLDLCGERQVVVSFLTEYGRFQARVHGPVSGNVLLRRTQYRQADDAQRSAELARLMVSAKIANCRTVLLRAARERPDDDAQREIVQAADQLANTLRRLREPMPLDILRGWEGDAAKGYFRVFDHLITKQKEDFYFHERSRRPPLDCVNGLLSFLYTLLVHDVTSALEAVGLDPAVGYLHTDRPGRPGLALDIMEEFRPFLADRLALSLINRQQIKGKGFDSTETGATRMDDETRKTVLVAYQERKQEEIEHPFLKEKMPVGLLPHVQALLLVRCLRGDLETYPPFIWR